MKGSQAKAEITEKILSTFEGSFLYNNGKELRIPIVEDGQIVQIKIAMTCAKVNVESGSDIALPTAGATQPASVDADPHLSETEKKEVNDLLDSLGL